MTEQVRVCGEGAVLTVLLDRPDKMNALTLDMYERLAEVFAGVRDDGPTRVVIVRGSGGRAFAAGTDISVFRDFTSADHGLGYEKRMDEILTVIEACPVPTIAALAGACTGGGAAIAAVCDLRIATRDLRYGFPIARTLGNCLSAANLKRLCGLIGVGPVTDMIVTSRLIGANDALRLGLVTEVHDTYEGLVSRAEALAGEISGYAPLTIRTTKEMLRRIRSSTAEIDDHDLIARCYTSQDFHEGLEAFLAKRPPRWTGR